MLLCSVVGGLPVLREMESIETDKKDRPLTDIIITSTVVFTDPYEEVWLRDCQCAALFVRIVAQSRCHRIIIAMSCSLLMTHSKNDSRMHVVSLSFPSPPSVHAG